MGVRGETIWALPGRAPVIADRAGGHDNHFNLIRMIAASGVLVSHAYPIALGDGAVEPLKPLLGMTLGTVCVLVFFAISGFYITRSFELRPDPARFLSARIYRLVPALLTVCIVTVLVAGLFLTSAPGAQFWPAGAEYLLRNVTLVKLLYPLPGVFEDNPFGPAINGSLWTLFYEVVCYMGVFLAGLAGLLHPKRFGWVVLLGLGLYLLNRAVQLPVRATLLADLSFPFLLGAMIWIWRDRVALSVPVLLLLSAVTVLTRATPAFEPLLVVTLAYGTLLLGFAKAPALLRYNRLGDYSYGMYIYAFPVQQLMAHFGTRDPLLNIALALPITLICAVLSWSLVEAPAQRFGRRPRKETA